MKKIFPIILFILIFFLAGFFRLVGNNWDQDQHLHPDERFLTMLAGSMEWPKSFIQYLDTYTSKLNPHNIDYGFYVYGTWPVIFVKTVAETLGKGDYSQLTLVGRALSGITDLLTGIIVFLIGYELTKKSSGGLAAFFIYAIAALPIQLSHFFTVDPYTALFATMAMYLMVKNRFGIFMGIAIGMTLAAKISGIYITPIIGLSYLITFIKSPRHNRIRLIIMIPLMILALYFTLRIAYPYLFLPTLAPALNPKVLANWKELSGFNDPNTYYPPGIQWIRTIPIVYPLLNLLYIGLGVPLGILCLLGVFYGLFYKRTQHTILLALTVLAIFIYQGTQFVKALRYFYIIYPILAVLGGVLISDIWDLKKLRPLLVGFLAVCLVWPIMFISIYIHPHSRIAASVWIYDHVAPGSAIAGEAWDDYLPVSLRNRIKENYQILTMPVTGPDTDEKWRQMEQMLAKSDYIVLSSNRGYGSMLGVPERYPKITQYYHALLDGSLGFQKVAEYTSRPTITVPGVNLCLIPPGLIYGSSYDFPPACLPNTISVVDDYADETWTVYDHPKVIIFQKVNQDINYHDLFLRK